MKMDDILQPIEEIYEYTSTGGDKKIILESLYNVAYYYDVNRMAVIYISKYTKGDPLFEFLPSNWEPI